MFTVHKMRNFHYVIIGNLVFGTAGSYELIPLICHIASHEAFDKHGGTNHLKYLFPNSQGA